MTEKTLVLEGLPADLDTIRPKLDLHFKNKRKSGGETLQIQDYPGDKRKALLVYHEDAALQKVLDRKCHKIDFKIPFGVVELQVKLKEDGETEVKKVKPPVFPRSTKDKLISLRKSSPNIEEKPASESLADSVTDDDIKLLLVRTTKEHEEDLLNLYFEQFASEEGGVSITRHEKNSWILKLSCQSDAEKVLAKKEHQYGISVEVYNETAVERKLDHRRFVLTGFNETCKCDIVSLFIGSCSQGADHAWETLDDGERIVVTFKQDIDIKSFLRKCLSKKFQGTEIRACRLLMTDSVLVQGDMKQIKGGVEEALNLYFSSRRSKGGAIRSQIWVTNGKSMVITFEDCHVAHQVAEHKHHFGGIDLTAQLFYSSLQKALTGQTALLPDIPTKVTLPLSTELLDFINRDETRKEEITTVLRRVHASVSFNTTTEPPLMEMDMTMENESLGMLRLFPTWERKAQREALALLEKYKEVQLPIEVEVWERIESGCLGLKTPGASISYRSTSAEIVLVCVQNEVKTLVEKIEHMVKRANDELERERNTLLRKIPLDSKEELDFVCDLVSGKLGDVGFYKDEESLIICLKGLENQVSTAEGAIKEALGNVEAKPLDISTPLMEFLKSLDLKKFEKNHFTPNNISSVFLLGDDSIQILAEKIDIQRAEDKLHKVIKEEVLKLTPGQTHVTKDKQWLQFFARLNGELKSTKNNNNVSISVSQEKIVVCGFSSVVADVSGKLRGYLDNKKPETADVLLKSVQEVQYVASCMNLSEVPEIKALGVTILPCKTQGSPCLKITAASDKIKEAFDVVKQQVSTIRTENYTYSEAGKSKVLEKNQVALQAKAKDLGCKLYLSPLITHCQKYSYDIEGCVTLTVGQGNISQHAADALICPLSSRLVFDNPIAKQFLQMGGPEIRKVCDKFLKERQTLQAGDVVLSNPGTLGAQHLIYAVIPIWGKASTPLNTVYLQSAVKNSLLEAENKKCVSIGMPVMGCGTFGFPVKESCVAVIKGILDFIYVDQKPPQLRSIFVIDSDAKTVREFQLAIEGKGYRRQQHNTPPPPPLAAKPASVIKVNPKRNLRPHKSKQAASTPQSSLPPNQVKIHGVRIEFRKGDITQETVRGIVNTTNADISLTVGVSAAIVKAAGSAVEQECKTICPLRADAAGVTSGGALQCDFILHILGPHSVADATLRVTKVLECCEDKQITTVSFPAVGTGGGGLSGTDSIGAILQGIQDHLSQCSSSTIIKLIYIVIYEDKILQEFQLGLNQWKTSQMVEDDSNLEDDLYGDEDDSDMPDTNSEEEDDTSVQTGNTIEAIIGPVKVKVVCGDITMEKTDAIVNSTNSSLDLNSGVSGAILKAAGQTVVDECKALGTQPSDGVVMTKPGNLKTKHIIHMVGQTKEKEITSSMLKVLKMCEDKKIQSVSFPALGTGAGNLGAVQVGNAMMAAIADLLISIRTPSVTTIHIVIFQAKMVKDFEEVMKKFKKVIPKPAAKTTRPAQPTPTKPALCLASATAAVVFPGMEAVVYGPSPASLSKVKKLLDELISEECISQDLPSSHLPQLLEAQKEAIVALSEKSQVRVLVASPDKMTVSGKKDDVLSAVLQIKDYLQGARDRESRKGEETRLRETVRWEAGEGETWGELDCSFSYDLELAFHRKEKIFKYNHQGETFTVDLKDMKQTDSKGTVTRVKRSLVADSDTAVIQFPQSWTRMEGKDLEIVTLAPNSGEYQRIEKEFIATSTDPNTNTRPTIQIVQIQRIQSKDQWQRYAVKKQAMDKKYPKNKNELNLYHGTTKDICQKINTCGFNRSFCGRNATMYGDGTYFAKEMWYSCHDTYSKPDASGLKYMYRARVLVGTPCLGVQGMKEPNPLNPADLHQGLHDCAVNDMQNPFIYVVFCDAGAYPDYIISFKTV